MICNVVQHNLIPPTVRENMTYHCVCTSQHDLSHCLQEHNTPHGSTQHDATLYYTTQTPLVQSNTTHCTVQYNIRLDCTIHHTHHIVQYNMTPDCTIRHTHTPHCTIQHDTGLYNTTHTHTTLYNTT